MVINTIDDQVASLEEWYQLRDKAAELDKPESTFQIHWDKEGSPVVSRGVDIPAQIRRQGYQQALSRHTTPGSHCLVSGFQDDELQRFDELARRAAIYLGHADLKGEAARDFFIVLLKNYFLEHKDHRRAVGLIGNHEGVIIERPFKAAKIYFGHLASDDPTPKAPTLGTSPTKGSERSDSEKKYNEPTENRRKVMFELLNRAHLTVKDEKDAAGAIRRYIHPLYKHFSEANITMIVSLEYHGITWRNLSEDEKLQKQHDRRIADCLIKDMRRNWGRRRDFGTSPTKSA